MQIVIDIPDKQYELIKKSGYNVFSIMAPTKECMMYAIKNGTPLPKGHGDLIDRKELMNAPYRKGGFVEWYDEIKYAEVIIPADKEECE